MEADGSDSSRPYLLVLLRHVARGTTLLVGSTHLKAKLSQEGTYDIYAYYASHHTHMHMHMHIHIHLHTDMHTHMHIQRVE